MFVRLFTSDGRLITFRASGHPQSSSERIYFVKNTNFGLKSKIVLKSQNLKVPNFVKVPKFPNLGLQSLKSQIWDFMDHWDWPVGRLGFLCDASQKESFFNTLLSQECLHLAGWPVGRLAVWPVGWLAG